MNDEDITKRSRHELAKIIADLEANAQIRESDWRRLFNRKNELEAENERLSNVVLANRQAEVMLVIEETAAKFLEVEKLREENERLRATIDNLADKLSQLGPAHAFEDAPWEVE